MIKKSDLFFCRYCDAELLNERVSNVAEDQNITEEEARELIEEAGEVGLCRDCQKEEDSDY
jgi:aerobic-type carbon monoxide dehydrogenase small subunit (CoxS/CutS family)